jgi:hypothetical protein
MYSNPLSMQNFSDPFITYDQTTGYYYFIASCQCDTLTIYRSKNVGDILKNGEMDAKKLCICCSKCTGIMRCPGGTPGCVIRDAEVYKPIYDKLVRGV